MKYKTNIGEQSILVLNNMNQNFHTIKELKIIYSNLSENRCQLTITDHIKMLEFLLQLIELEKLRGLLYNPFSEIFETKSKLLVDGREMKLEEFIEEYM